MSEFKYALPRDLGDRMCAAWGINSAECLAIDVHWRPNEMPYATVDLLLSESAVREVLTLSVIERRVVDPDVEGVEP